MQPAERPLYENRKFLMTAASITLAWMLYICLTANYRPSADRLTAVFCSKSGIPEENITILKWAEDEQHIAVLFGYRGGFSAALFKRNLLNIWELIVYTTGNSSPAGNIIEPYNGLACGKNAVQVPYYCDPDRQSGTELTLYLAVTTGKRMVSGVKEITLEEPCYIEILHIPQSDGLAWVYSSLSQIPGLLSSGSK